MHTSNLLAFLSGLLASACASPLSHHSGPRADGQGQVCATDNYCAGTNFNESLVPQYICGDPHLGPTQLPTHLPLDTLFSTYNRFSGLCPGAFLIKYFNASAGNGGRWIYPDYDGFELDTVNKTISGTILLKPGTLLDRFGAETGGFLSPAEAPFLQRSLPPDSLDNNGSDPRYPYNYHMYRVKRVFAVSAGPIAGAFGQPGQGVQYHLLQPARVNETLRLGIIERVDLKDF